MAALKMPDLNPSSYRLLTDAAAAGRRFNPHHRLLQTGNEYICIYIYFYTYTLSWQGGFHFFQI